MRSRALSFLLLATAPFAAFCAETPAVFIGESKQDAIEVCAPAGQRAYLSRLMCPSGETPNYRRVGSYGERNEYPANLSREQQDALLERLLRRAPLQPGEVDHHIVDGYELTCGDTRHMVYLDMYHCDQPPPVVAPRGFTIRVVK